MILLHISGPPDPELDCPTTPKKIIQPFTKPEDRPVLFDYGTITIKDAVDTTAEFDQSMHFSSVCQTVCQYVGKLYPPAF